MAKDDYEVIVCRILVYLYKKIKGKLTPEDDYYLYPMTKQFPISGEYLNSVLIDLNARGMISGIKIIRAWGGEVIDIDSHNAKITLEGVQYLRENAAIRRIAETLKEAIPILSLFD